MERKDFIRQCGFACLGTLGVSMLAQGCASTGQINTPIVNNRMKVKATSFLASTQNGEIKYKRFLVLRNDQLNFPIVLYRNNEKHYTALLLRCSHQYNELNVNGELLTCPAHGSEFDSKGNVVTGPADSQLRSFPVSFDEEHILIHLV